MQSVQPVIHKIDAAVLTFMEAGRVLWILDAVGSTILRLGFFERGSIRTRKPHFDAMEIYPTTNEIFVNGSVSYCLGTGYDDTYQQLSIDELGSIDYAEKDKMISVRVDCVIFEEGDDKILVFRDGMVVLQLTLDGVVTSEKCETSPSSHIDLSSYDDFEMLLPFTNCN